MANSNGWGDGAANNNVGWGQGANNAIGWGSSHATSWAGLTDIVGLTTDPSASAFIAATGITGATQQSAVDALVKGLKADGLWSKMKAVYPFVTDNRNLLGYTEAFDNAAWGKVGATVTANNILAPDGTMTADRVVFGAANNYIFQQTTSVNTTANKSIYIKGTAGQTISLDDTWVLSPANLITLTGDWQRVNFTSTTTSGQAQGLAISTFQSATARTIWVWGAQLELGSTATTYQPIATTQQAYIASQFKYNLVNPVDSDAAFRLVFNGGWTHSSTGATPNGTNGYADTKLVPSSVLSSGGHFSYYSRTDKNNIVLEQIGGNSSNGHIALVPRYLDSVYYSFQSAAETQITTIANSLNLHINNRNGGNQQFHKSGVKLSDVTVNASPMPTVNIYLGTINNNGTPLYFSSMQTAFSSIGDGLTDTDATNLYTRVQAFQTALSRNV
jgi:hypothetical protein